ncbi:MAG: class I SAM-dependent methyltransferase [Chloroflexi bacterium]|nr:MAG: class I SAM-dependent methyltransferase [Chloroflexota bacterium]MBL1194467.1 class I SAM-dependent methyltransferase [Chloroflexota bacterium]NOH11755.1 class I SAM-dependent methyltransferase [Chloroflexota bacterium]
MSKPLERGEDRPPVCDYEGSDYQSSFWDEGGRAYEDRVEAIALKRLLPASGELMLEVGAGAGRNTPRYHGYQRIVVMDYSRTQLQQAQQRLGRSERYIYVATDVYKMPFVGSLFDGATMIRVLHHMADAPKALAEVRRVMQPGGTFILEFANKLNLKAILRYLFRRQDWSPFTREPVEFVALNFDFHPAAVRQWLQEIGFSIKRQLTVSHYRIGFLKRTVPVAILAWLDSLAQWTGDLWQLSPSVFVKSQANAEGQKAAADSFFQCPQCAQPLPDTDKDYLECTNAHRWGIIDGIYDFKSPLS